MNGMMKAAVLKAAGKLEITTVPIPQPGPNDVLVKVSACGICGSDIPRVVQTGTYHFPTIPGHEFGGRVCETGAFADAKWNGKKVAVIPLIPCQNCSPCSVGDYAQCTNYDFLGSRSDGGFAEYVKVPAANLIEVPEAVDEDSVAFLEPISVALHVVQNCGVGYGDNIAVFGLGAIGIFIAQWAKVFGAAHVFALDVDAAKVRIAKEELGLIDSLCIGQDDIETAIKERTNGQLLDAAFEASGSPKAFEQALFLLRTSGKLGLVGRPAEAIALTSSMFERILRSQLTIKGTWSFEFKNFPHHAWELSLAALLKGEIQTEPIISHRIPLADTMKGISIMNNKSESFYKILVKPQL